ncbi:MAG: hypothetical protein QOJ85_975, partial [Solirubrobacteraceae bacterium]|nr:hypothetical protein [Solirubrobacteraceae bacterium]
MPLAGRTGPPADELAKHRMWLLEDQAPP